MKFELDPRVDAYLAQGCMRCPFGGTPRCKVHPWRAELEMLRQVVLEAGLKEELKWGAPVYTHKGKNIVAVAALKDYVTIGFFKGVLLSDPNGLLQQQGNMQSDRIIRFTKGMAIEPLTDVLKQYVLEAVVIEESGRKVEFKKNPEPMPDELLQAFEDDPVFSRAFYALTPGRQRGYIIHFSQPKASATRTARITKQKQRIFDGVGLNDR